MLSQIYHQSGDNAAISVADIIVVVDVAGVANIARAKTIVSVRRSQPPIAVAVIACVSIHICSCRPAVVACQPSSCGIVGVIITAKAISGVDHLSVARQKYLVVGVGAGIGVATVACAVYAVVYICYLYQLLL